MPIEETDQEHMIERQPVRRLIMFEGRVSSDSDNRTSIYNNAYLANVAGVKRVLKPSIVSQQSQGDFSSLFYPRNIMAPSENILIIKSQASLPADIPSNSRVIEDNELGDGGIYKGAETGDLVFIVLNQSHNRVEKERILRTRIFPGKTVVILPTPRETGIKDLRRVVEHVDQFIAHPLPLQNSKGYVVPIDEKYYDYLSSHKLLPTHLSDGREIRYVRISHRFTSANQLLNTLASPTGAIFIEPDLKVALEEQGKWDGIDKTNVHVLSSNIPAYDDPQIGYKAGLGCKVVLAAI